MAWTSSQVCHEIESQIKADGREDLVRDIAKHGSLELLAKVDEKRIVMYQLLRRKGDRTHISSAFPQLDVEHREPESARVSFDNLRCLLCRHTSRALEKAARRIAKNSRAPRL